MDLTPPVSAVDEPRDPLLDELSDLFRFDDVVYEAAGALPLVARPLPIHPLRNAPAVVLVIDSDDRARDATKRALEDGGYTVLGAATAERGVILARARVVDAIVCDLDLVDGDGWGVLTTLRGAAAASEIKFVLWGNDVDAVQEVACAGVGADVCEDKAVDIVTVVDRVLARRFGVLSSLEGGAWGTLSDVGVQSLLDGACQCGVRGRLTVDDGVSTFTVDVDDGVIANAAIQSAVDGDDTLQPVDRQALLALLNVRDAPWSFEPRAPLPPSTLGLPWSRLARELCAAVDERRARVRANWLAQPLPVTLDAARLQLWMARAPDRAIAVATALKDGAVPSDIIDASPSPLFVDEVLQDLVDRNVVLFLPEPVTPRVRCAPTSSVRPAMAPRTRSVAQVPTSTRAATKPQPAPHFART